MSRETDRPLQVTGRRRDRVAAVSAIIGGLVLLTAVVALAARPEQSNDTAPGSDVPMSGVPAATQSVPVQAATEFAPGIADARQPPDPGQRPEATLVAAIGGRLVLTDLDGQVLRDAAWQPSTQDLIAEVVTDGETVVTWQPPCTLEAGLLLHDTAISLQADGTCAGPAAIDAETGMIMWLSGPSATATGADRSIEYFRQDPQSASAGGFNEPGLLEADDRVVGIDRVAGVARLLVRRSFLNAIEVLALPIERVAIGGAEQGTGAGIATEGFRPAFAHLDGYIPLDVGSSWVLDARWVFPNGDRSRGIIEEIRVRPVRGPSRSFGYGGLSVDPTSVWFDSSGDATIWAHGEAEAPKWSVV